MPRVSDFDIEAARRVDLTSYLESMGLVVKRDGRRHLTVQRHGEEVYRGTLRSDGHYVWCDRYQGGIGDNIALVREIVPGTGFSAAVNQLSGAPAVDPRHAPSPPPPHTPPKLPPNTDSARAAGRCYLQGRGITLSTIDHAEQVGMVRYVDGGVLFVGYDQHGVPQNATRRAIAPADRVQKRDLRGSDKSYPPILPGEPAKVWIVEGGTDALALHDIAKRHGQPPPTVIVSGGANVRKFLELDEVQAILKQAEYVTVVGENEKNQETQAVTDGGHQRQAQRVAEITGREVRQWTPKPEQGKDLADMNYLARAKKNTSTAKC